MIDPIKYYSLENFLLVDVRNRFLQDKSIGAFDLFSIVVWKSNRSKSKVANRLMKKAKSLDLEQISRAITSSLATAPSEKERMRILIVEWGFRIAIASAILTILYPDSFTIYDYRAADQIGAGSDLKTKVKFEQIWQGYVSFRSKVMAIPHGATLREKDHYLFGRSRMEDLNRDLKNGFSDEPEEA